MITVRDPSGSRQGATQADLRIVAQVAGEEVAALAPGRVAILAPEPILDSLAEALEADGRTVVDARDMGKAVCSSPWCRWLPTPPTASSSTRSLWSSQASSPVRRREACGRCTWR